MTRLAAERPYSNPETAARKLLELAKSIEAVQDGRIHIEKINAPFLSKDGCKATGPEFGAGIRFAIEQGWLELHESGTYVRLKKAGEDLLAHAGELRKQKLGPYRLMEIMAAKPTAAAPHASTCNVQGRIVIVAASSHMGGCGRLACAN
ncbi:hypothetical protein [Bradyrhizobium huanghuaihaiense]|uniref:hypothetical protein n=1 Tax=Bradyrhizobium huanghuaihaiense TaxID=990078 RepID=UPI002889B8AE|nr:hypothetical protein [Bradyrhizobium sp. CB3035]